MQHNIALVFTDANQKGERIAKGKLVDYCIGPSQWRNTQFSLYTRLPWQYRFVHHEAHPHLG
jgi:hypothetical protein